MADKIEVKLEIQGYEKLQRKLEKEAMLGEPLRQTMNQAALTLEREVKMVTPVDTGRLRASWTSAISAEPVPLWAKVGSDVTYAVAVEYGRGRMEPRHVEPGSQARVRGKGPMTYAMERVKAKIDVLLKRAEKLLEERFGK